MILLVEKKADKILSIGEPQAIRLIDVFFLAPLMIYTAVKYKNAPKTIRIIWLTTGILTAVYNWRNYSIQKKIENLNRVPDQFSLIKGALFDD